MENKKFEDLWEIYSKAQSENEQKEIMKNFMLDASLEELLAWNRFLAKKGEMTWEKHRKTGLTSEEKTWYQQQFAQFDSIELQLKQGTSL